MNTLSPVTTVSASIPEQSEDIENYVLRILHEDLQPVVHFLNQQEAKELLLSGVLKAERKFLIRPDLQDPTKIIVVKCFHKDEIREFSYQVKKSANPASRSGFAFVGPDLNEGAVKTHTFYSTRTFLDFLILLEKEKFLTPREKNTADIINSFACEKLSGMFECVNRREAKLLLSDPAEKRSLLVRASLQNSTKIVVAMRFNLDGRIKVIEFPFHIKACAPNDRYAACKITGTSISKKHLRNVVFYSQTTFQRYLESCQMRTTQTPAVQELADDVEAILCDESIWPFVEDVDSEQAKEILMSRKIGNDTSWLLRPCFEDPTKFFVARRHHQSENVTVREYEYQVVKSQDLAAIHGYKILGSTGGMNSSAKMTFYSLSAFVTYCKMVTASPVGCRFASCKIPY